MGCVVFFFFSSRRRHTRYWRDWSSDVCSSDLQRSRVGKVVLVDAKNDIHQNHLVAILHAVNSQAKNHFI